MAFQGFDELNCLFHSSLSPANYALSPSPSPSPLSDSMVAYSRSNQSMDNPLQNQQWHDEDIVHLPREGIMTMNMLELQSNNQDIFRTPAAPPISRTKSYTGISQRFNRESDEAIEYYDKLTCYNFPASTSYFPLSQLPSFPTSSNSMAVCLWCNQSIENLPQNEQYKGIGDPSLSFKEQLRVILSATEEVVRIRMVFREMSSTRKEKTPGGTSGNKKTTTTTRVAGFEIMRANQPSYFPHRINPAVFNCPEVLENMKRAEPTAAMSAAIRKDYLNLRRHAISIQAVYRGFQVRKHYRRMRWAVGVLEKELLRWRRSADSMDSNLLADLTMENLPQNQQHHSIVDPPLFVMEEDEVGTVGNEGEGTGVDEMEEDEVEVAVGIGGEEGTGEGEKSPGGESGNKKTTRVTTEILLEESLQTKRMTKGTRLEDAAKNLNVSQYTLKHNLIRQSRPNATRAVVDQERISQLNFDTLPSEQGLAAIADTNSFVVKKIPKPRARSDEDLGNHGVEAIGMVGEETGEGEMEEDQLNSEHLEKGKRKEKIPREERGSKKTNGYRIGISMEDILRNEGMSLKDAANNLNGSVHNSSIEKLLQESEQ